MTTRHCGFWHGALQNAVGSTIAGLIAIFALWVIATLHSGTAPSLVDLTNAVRDQPRIEWQARAWTATKYEYTTIFDQSPSYTLATYQVMVTNTGTAPCERCTISMSSSMEAVSVSAVGNVELRDASGQWVSLNTTQRRLPGRVRLVETRALSLYPGESAQIDVTVRRAIDSPWEFPATDVRFARGEGSQAPPAARAFLRDYAGSEK